METRLIPTCVQTPQIKSREGIRTRHKPSATRTDATSRQRTISLSALPAIGFGGLSERFANKGRDSPVPVDSDDEEDEDKEATASSSVPRREREFLHQSEEGHVGRGSAEEGVAATHDAVGDAPILVPAERPSSEPSGMHDYFRGKIKDRVAAQKRRRQRAEEQIIVVGTNKNEETRPKSVGSGSVGSLRDFMTWQHRGQGLEVDWKDGDDDDDDLIWLPVRATRMGGGAVIPHQIFEDWEPCRNAEYRASTA